MITNVMKREVIYLTMSTSVVPRISIRILVKTVVMKSEENIALCNGVANILLSCVS